MNYVDVYQEGTGLQGMKQPLNSGPKHGHRVASALYTELITLVRNIQLTTPSEQTERTSCNDCTCMAYSMLSVKIFLGP